MVIFRANVTFADVAGEKSLSASQTFPLRNLELINYSDFWVANVLKARVKKKRDK